MNHAERVDHIHSHGKYDIPFSGTDVTNLFPRPGLELPPAATILVTPSVKMLLARSEDTIGMQLTKDIRPDFYTEIPQERMHSLTRVAQEYRLRIYGAARSNRILTLSH